MTPPARAPPLPTIAGPDTGAGGDRLPAPDEPADRAAQAMAGGWNAAISAQGTNSPRPSGTARQGTLYLGDAGWGGLVRQGKYRDRRFADDLMEACVRLVREWNPQPAPAWVTCIPSIRHPNLVPDFARRLAAALNLPFYASLEKTETDRSKRPWRIALNRPGISMVRCESLPEH